MDTVNERAEDMTVRLSDGTEKKLSVFWATRTLVLVFVRHFG